MGVYLQNVELIKEDLVGLPQLQERYQLLTDALVEQHPGKIVDEAKCILESVFRTIAIDFLGTDQQIRIYKLSMPALFEEVSQCITISDDETMGIQILNMCRPNFTQIGQLRNANGASSHGRDAYHESSLGVAEAHYLANTAIAMAVLFYGRHKTRPNRHINKRLLYEEYPEFNESLDEQYIFEVAGTTLIPSEALYKADFEAYRNALIEFSEQNKVV